MKFELVALNAKYIHSNPALFSLRSYALKVHPEYADNIVITEYTINNRTEEILSGLYHSHADVIAFSCYIWNITMIESLITDLKKIMPEVKIWLGGPEVSYEAEKLMSEYPALDGIMVGEGEQTFTSLMEFYMSDDVEDEDRLQQIPGLVLPGGVTGTRNITNLDDLPFFYDHLEQFQNKILYYESSRGCPYHCSYCLSSIDKTTRFRSISLVQAELQFFLDNAVSQVKFVDRTFNCNHEHAMEIWNYIYKHDNGVTNFHFEIAADIMNEEELALLHQMRPGLAQLEIGIQTTNPDTLNAIDRSMNLDHVRRVVETIRSGNNIHVHLDLIAGLPKEDYNSFIRSFNDVYLMKPEQLQLGFLKVLKGSKMHDCASEYGLVYSELPPYEVMKTNWITFDEILLLKEVEEMVEVYYNSSQFRHILRILVEETDSPYSFYRALADYYKEKGYTVNTPSRIMKYHILLEFAIARHPEKEPLYRELMVFELYLRENMKSRPDFAEDQTTDYDTIFSFYREEEMTHRYLPAYREYHAKQLMKMTHMERFHYPVWEEEGNMDLLQVGRFVLFDYEKRNPLTYDAQIMVL